MPSRRPYRDPGRKPTVTDGGRTIDDDSGKIVTSAGVGRMIGSVAPRELTVEEAAEPMPTPTQPLRTGPPS